MISENNITTQFSDDTINIIKNLIKYQNEKLIKHIAKEKGWNEQELLEEFLFNFNNSNNYMNIINTQISKNTDKKKSVNLNMDKINDNDSDSDSYSPVLSQSSSCQSLDSLTNSETKKKRGRPKKNTSANVEPELNTDKKKKGRPKKIQETDKTKLEQMKRKRGRPKKIQDTDIINDPNIELKEDLTDQDSIELLSQHDQKLYEEKEKKLKGSFSNVVILQHNTEFDDNSILSEESNLVSDIEYEEITCETIIYEDIKYLINPINNNVYSTQDENTYIGKYNNSVIDFNAKE